MFKPDRLVSKILLFTLAVSLFGLPVHGSTNQESLARLSVPLEEIGSDARAGRRWGGGLLLGTGALIMGAAAFADSDSAALLGGGAVLAGVGGLILALPTEYERLPDEFAQAPASTPEEQSAKIMKGEAALGRLSARARDERVSGAILALALGGASLFLASSIDGDGALSSSVKSVYLYEGVLLGGIGIFNLLRETSPERGNRLYREWRQEKRSAASLRGFALMRTRSGIAVGPSWAF